jgi:hypothetical protein
VCKTIYFYVNQGLTPVFDKKDKNNKHAVNFSYVVLVARHPNIWQAGKRALGAKNGPKRQNPRGDYQSPVIYW